MKGCILIYAKVAQIIHTTVTEFTLAVVLFTYSAQKQHFKICKQHVAVRLCMKIEIIKTKHEFFKFYQ
jgi:hypothetical protein